MSIAKSERQLVVMANLATTSRRYLQLYKFLDGSTIPVAKVAAGRAYANIVEVRDGSLAGFVGAVRKALASPTTDAVDLVLDVDNKDDQYDRVETAVAKVEVTADMISFKVVGEEAWGFQAVIGYSDVVTVGVSQRYLPDNPDVDGKMIYLGNTGASQTASSYVMGPCVPEGYNDQPSSEPEPPSDEDDDTEGVSPR